MMDDADRVRALLERGPDVVVSVGSTGRVVAADVEGDPDGVPVVLIHGTPDSRLARHPDAAIVADLGIRLVAVDRPGFGHTSADPSATPSTFADDLTALLDHLEIPSAHLLAWSAGTIWAVGAATMLGERARSVTAVGGLVPFEAFADPEVAAAAGPARIGMIETARELGAEGAAEMIAPMLVADPITPETALEHRAEAGDHDVSTVPGADVRMAAAACDAVRGGPAGLIRDVTVQFIDSGVGLADIDVSTRFVTGADDETCPPAFTRWYARRVPGATAEIVDDAGHGLLLTHWRTILSDILDT